MVIMSKIRLTIDAEKAAKISELAAEIVLTALDDANADMKKTLAAQLDKGTLYLHVQVHPSRLVILASDPSDPDLPPIELAAWS
jgi:hypothetical protein